MWRPESIWAHCRLCLWALGHLGTQPCQTSRLSRQTLKSLARLSCRGDGELRLRFVVIHFDIDPFLGDRTSVHLLFPSLFHQP